MRINTLRAMFASGKGFGEKLLLPKTTSDTGRIGFGKRNNAGRRSGLKEEGM